MKENWTFLPYTFSKLIKSNTAKKCHGIEMYGIPTMMKVFCICFYFHNESQSVNNYILFEIVSLYSIVFIRFLDYEGYDDVYGHSLDDEYGTSPSGKLLF